MYIDSHTHLDDRRYQQDLDAVLGRAHEAGLEALVTIGCDLSTSRAAVDLAERYSFVYATIGVHPHEARHMTDRWFPDLEGLAKHPKVVAYGEIGLDYHYDHSPRDVQRARFHDQIVLARELGLPLVIHTREAQEDTVSILAESQASRVGGVFHCFSGDVWLAEQALGLGFSISFSGIVTFKNAEDLRGIALTIPLDRLMIETDCPYLAPIPYRSKRNEPAYVVRVAEQLAVLRPQELPSPADVGFVTAQNTKRLFKMP